MSKVNKFIAVVLVLAAALAARTSSETAVLTATPFTKSPLPAADQPNGWVPVAYGDAEVSVPPTWAVMTDAWCGGAWPSIVQLGVVTQDMDCPAAPTPPMVRITPLGTIPAPYAQEQPSRLNGIPVLLGPKNATSISYFVPSLHVEVWASDGSGVRVIDTLGVSPRAVVLASGRGPQRPSSWRSVSFAGIHFSVPANWPIARTQVTPGLGAICRQKGVAFPDTTVTLSTDARPLLLPPCPSFHRLPSRHRMASKSILGYVPSRW